MTAQLGTTHYTELNQSAWTLQSRHNEHGYNNLMHITNYRIQQSKYTNCLQN